MLVSVWEYRVAADRAAAFERMYGPSGEWRRLFSGSEGYVRSELCLDLGQAGRYVVRDYWTSLEAFDRFREEHGVEHEALDHRCEGLSERKIHVGSFLCIET
jgi:heme-degrading monooxygenase HmoA